jgi:7-keto-8-aminopelargonate synthetase-like enzyme
MRRPDGSNEPKMPNFATNSQHASLAYEGSSPTRHMTREGSKYLDPRSNSYLHTSNHEQSLEHSHTFTEQTFNRKAPSYHQSSVESQVALNQRIERLRSELSTGMAPQSFVSNAAGSNDFGGKPHCPLRNSLSPTKKLPTSGKEGHY